jgi:hypothetical protein
LIAGPARSQLTAEHEANLTPEHRKQLRHEQAAGVGRAQTLAGCETRPHPAQMLIGEAMTYFDNQWPELIRALDDGRLEVDNNRCENALRPFVMTESYCTSSSSGASTWYRDLLSWMAINRTPTSHSRKQHWLSSSPTRKGSELASGGGPAFSPS